MKTRCGSRRERLIYSGVLERELRARLVFIGFADDRRFVGLVFVLFVLVLIIIVVGISRWCRVANAAENMSCPLLLQTSVKL
jgi:hypothetical protein